MSNDDKYCHISDISLGGHMENFNVETSALHRKLQSKADALRILRQEVESFRTERDQFKLMAETLQLRYCAIRRSSELCCSGGGSKSTVASLLHDTRERNLRLTTEVESLKQKLGEIQGDIEILRKTNQIEKEQKNKEIKFDKRSSVESIESWKEERAMFIENMECLKRQNAQQAADLKAIIDEKEELIVERDGYKCKTHRLNHELFSALKANQKNTKLIDVDSIIMENKYLNERLKNYEIEMSLMKKNLSKYKCMLETKGKKGIMRLSSESSSDNILSPKQVQSLLDNGIELPSKTETVHDLKSLCYSLLDNLSDKKLALAHQKKTNRILGSKIGELEQRIRCMAGIDEPAEDGFSPADLLLNGYSPIYVDPSDSNTTLQSADSTEEVRKNSADSCRKNSTDDLNKNGSEDSNKRTIFDSARIGTIDESSTQSTDDDSTLKNTEDSERECDERQTSIGQSDDSMSTDSTESARSVLSSEYSGIINGVAPNRYSYDLPNKNTFPYDKLITDNKTETDRSSIGSLVPFNIEQERINDLKDLPPELAAIIQNALRDLDILDFEKNQVNHYQSKCKCSEQREFISSQIHCVCISKESKESKSKTKPSDLCKYSKEVVVRSNVNGGKRASAKKDLHKNDYVLSKARERKSTGDESKIKPKLLSLQKDHSGHKDVQRTQRGNSTKMDNNFCTDDEKPTCSSFIKDNDLKFGVEKRPQRTGLDIERISGRITRPDDDDDDCDSQGFTSLKEDDYNFGNKKKSMDSVLLDDEDGSNCGEAGELRKLIEKTPESNAQAIDDGKRLQENQKTLKKGKKDKDNKYESKK